MKLTFRSGAPAAQRAAAPLLLELPIVLARIIDHLEAPGQLVAWIRVAVEVLEEGAVAALDGGSGTEGWALRFCARCVDRCAGQLSPGGADFPASWPNVLCHRTPSFDVNLI